ncbi:Calx-beta domain-containing protein [Falsiroseomonas selenitidurans]|uniref:cellulase n=1 Tax=Falsiroseomonas selenitidurans TaxID=2716335 RepID=A0ABX1E5B3_9PROT|nr:Calx-beta domain-containing protein [Falsiroseomonas selenitidurans]NKC30697.1 cellulase family glycosylhydrolase [Falsiroseomonas selenitidurans]
MAVQVGFARTSDWGLGFVGQVTLTPDTALNGWTLSFAAGFTIDNIWGAELVSQSGGITTLRNAGWNGVVAAGGTLGFGFTASPGGSVADPAGWTLGGQVVAPPAPPLVSVADTTAWEAAGVALFQVSLSQASATPVTIHYATDPGTARAGRDYATATGSLTFAPGETSRSIAIALLDDSLPEGSEAFSLRLTEARGATLGDGVAAAVIQDDDGPRLSVGDATVVERHGGQVNLVFTVTLSEAAAQNVVFRYATADGTARAGEDYLAASGSMTIAAGTTSRTVTVKVLGDRVTEADETLFLRLSDPVRGVLADAEGLGSIRNDDLPRLLIADSPAVTEGDAGAHRMVGALSTRGAQIIDATGTAVQIAAVNWFGLETTSFAPHGLHLRNWQEMMDQMAGLGFNAIRLPFSAEAIQKGGTPSGIDFNLNPDLAGLTPIQIIDRIVAYAGEIGLRIILDHHRSSAGNGPNGNGLWHEGEYTTARWVRMWEGLAERYAGNPTVIGAELHNEPHGANWKSWAHAAEIAGNAVLAKNPDWLVLVEGVGEHNGEHYWWGGNLIGARDRPVVLSAPDKLVYAPHDYPNSVYPQPFFYAADFPENLPAIFDRMWGYLAKEGIAPVLVSEMGSRLSDPRDVAWLDKLVAYLSGDTDANGVQDLAGPGLSYAWWSWNPNSGDTGGILADDWRTVLPAKIAALDPILPDPPGTLHRATFDVTLTAAPAEPVLVHWRTVPGSAGEADFVAAAGILIFEPGETRRSISIDLLADSVPEGTEWFKVELSTPVGATIADGNGIARITDDDWIV